MKEFTLLGLSQTYSIISLISAITLTAVLTIVAIKYYWEQISFFMTRVKLGMPVIGRINKLSKDIDSISEKKWFFSEEDLAASFLPYYEKAADMDEGYFHHCHGYMRKAHDLGTKPMSILLWILIIAMVVVESFGFSYVLSGYTLPGASEGLQQKGAIGIAFLISTILVFLTHHSGTEIRSNSAIKKCRVWFNKSKDQKVLKPNNEVSLANDALDDHEPDYIQLLSRIRDVNAEITPSWKISIMTIIFVTAVAVGSTYVRGKVLERDIIHESIGSTQSSSMPNFGNPYAETLPSGLRSAASEAEEIAAKDEIDTQRKGGWATFIVLAVIFVFLQILGVLIGYKTSFVGRESKEAYKVVGRFKNERDFINYYKRKRNHIAGTAQKYLSHLQKLMSQRSEKLNIDSTSKRLISQNNGRTFLGYVDLVHEETLASDRKRKEKDASHNSHIESLQNSNASSTPSGSSMNSKKFNDEEIRRATIRERLLDEMKAKELEQTSTPLTDEEIEAQEREKILSEQKKSPLTNSEI